MGIKGLLPLLEGIQKHTHLKNFSGETLGVDAYGWLHRGTFGCAVDLAQGRPTRGYVNFAMNRVRMLLHFGVTPYVVFDGDYLPSKAHTEKDRAARRKESRKRGLSLLQAGKTQQASQELQKSVDVTPLMARELIEELKVAGISYVVAPFEADSQLAYLEKQGLISGIISEDSDLLVFGASRLITKLDQYGTCVMIRRQDFTQCREISLINWSDKDFRMMAMLSGCDYLPGIDGLGLKTAYRMVRKYKSIESIVRNIQFDGKKKVPPEFLKAFYEADRTFLHQWVFCPQARHLVNLTSIPADLSLDDMPYIGNCVEPELARGVASGDLDPNTKQQMILPRGIHLPRRSTYSTPATPDLKSKKPISEYFKPTRTPLAELDPNSFTPSPSQQRLLTTQQNRSWSSPQVQTLHRSSSDMLHRTSFHGQAPELLRSASASKPLSPRRKRLCADVLADLQGTSSHYFGEVVPKARKAKDEFELFSDDSVAEAMRASTEALEQSISLSQKAAKPAESDRSSPKKRKRMAIYHDNLSPRESVQRDSQISADTTLQNCDTVTSASFLHSQDELPKSETITDFERLAAPWTFEEPATLIEASPSQPRQTSKPKHFILEQPTISIDETTTVSHTFEVKGSEDILIPQSPSSNEDDGRLRPKLNLGRFVYTA